MSEEKESEIFYLLQPELMTPEQLVTLIKSRCPTLQNVTALPKDRLVRIYRQTVLPMPQRRYRANRGGKLLSARRRRAGLEQAEDGKSAGEKRQNPNDRLKPTPDSSTPNKIRITSSASRGNLDKIVINDRRRRDSDEWKYGTKRTSSDKRSDDGYQTTKKQRTEIRWP